MMDETKMASGMSNVETGDMGKASEAGCQMTCPKCGYCADEGEFATDETPGEDQGAPVEKNTPGKEALKALLAKKV